MSAMIQMILVTVFAGLALVHFVASQGHSYTHLSNGLGFKYNYGIQHGHHGHAYGSSYPNGYGGFGDAGAGIGGGFAGGYGGGFAG